MRGRRLTVNIQKNMEAGREGDAPMWDLKQMVRQGLLWFFFNVKVKWDGSQIILSPLGSCCAACVTWAWARAAWKRRCTRRPESWWRPFDAFTAPRPSLILSKPHRSTSSGRWWRVRGHRVSTHWMNLSVGLCSLLMFDVQVSFSQVIAGTVTIFFYLREALWLRLTRYQGNIKSR